MYTYNELTIEEIINVIFKLNFDCVCDGDSKIIKLVPRIDK